MKKFNEIFNKIGEFWTPENNKKISGILKEEKNSTIIYLDTISYNINDNFFNEETNESCQNNPIIILGHIETYLVTLIACPFFLHQSTSIGDGSCFSYSYGITSIILGKHFNNIEDIKFSNASIIIDNISHVFRKKFIKKNFDEEKFVVSFDNSKYKIYQDNFSLNVMPTLNIEQNRFLIGNISNKIIFNESIKLKIEYDGKNSFDSIKRDVIHIEKLFSFISGRSSIVEFSAIIDDDKSIYIYGDYSSNNNKKNLSMFNVLFTLDNSDIDSDSLIKNWFDKYTDEKMKPLLDIYFLILSSDTYEESKLILYTQALESYHKNFLSSIKSDRINLRLRLKEIINDLSKFSLIESILENFDDNDCFDRVDNFVDAIIKSRNYYTHYDVDKRVSSKDLHKLNKRLKYIIELCILCELGLSDEIIEKIIEKQDNRRFYLD
nr:HEPN domain-containing protein [Methanobrevibacter arboriphilus]